MSAATKNTQAKSSPTYKHTLTTSTDRTIEVERVFNAPRERVWRAHTDPSLLAQWWGRGNKLDVETYELKPGGKWRFVEHAEGKSFAFSGEFREIRPMDRIVMTFGWDEMQGHTILNTLDFVDLGDGRTKLIATSTFTSRDERDAMIGYGMEAGMNESYEALDRLLAQL
jgi:uncharacterized protein YndB with AHSA1/START domain